MVKTIVYFVVGVVSFGFGWVQGFAKGTIERIKEALK